MATSVKFVEILCPNGRRQKIAANPSMTVLQILQQVCKKQGYSDAEYDLKHQRKVLNVTSMMRFLNLPNNAKLEMVTCEKPRLVSNVTVALQLEDGTRYQDEFKPDMTLLDVLRSQVNEIEEKLSEKEPVCIYMRNEYKGSIVLSSITLKSLGITSGRAAIRVVFREIGHASTSSTSVEDEVIRSNRNDVVRTIETADSESNSSRGEKASNPVPCELKEPNEKKIRLEPSVPYKQTQLSNQGKPPPSEGNAFKSLSIFGAPPKPIFPTDGSTIGNGDILNSPVHVDAVNDTRTNEFADFKFPDRSPDEESDDLAIDPHQLRKEVKLGMACNREALIYSMEVIESLKGTAQDIDDSFFQVTIDDLRKRLSDLKSERKGMEEASLMTSALRQQQKIQRMSNFEKIPVRFLLPDKLVLQGIFRPLETIGAIKEFLDGYISKDVKKYEIFVTPPRTVLKDKNQTLYDAKLFPAAIVHISFRNSADSYLKSELTNSISTYEEAESVVDKILKRKACDATQPLSINEAVKSRQDELRHSHSSSLSSNNIGGQTSSEKYKPKGAPKWFKTGR